MPAPPTPPRLTLKTECQHHHFPLQPDYRVLWTFTPNHTSTQVIFTFECRGHRGVPLCCVTGAGQKFSSLREAAEHLWGYKNVSRTSIDIIVGLLFHFKSTNGTKVFYIRWGFFFLFLQLGGKKIFTRKLSMTGLPLCGTRLEHRGRRSQAKPPKLSSPLWDGCRFDA